jgi:glutamate synthase domain-containing protein 3
VLDDAEGHFRQNRCNRESVDLEPLTGDDEAELVDLIVAHFTVTGSAVASRILESRKLIKRRFVKVMPREYKRAIVRLTKEEN